MKDKLSQNCHFKSTTFVRQHDAMQCGIASLAMVCRAWGLFIPLSELEELCPPSSEGVSLRGIKIVSEELGFNTMPIKTGIESLPIDQPVILHWDQCHFVVLFKIDTKKNLFYVADPAKGILKYKTDEFKNHWESIHDEKGARGIALLMTPSQSFWEKKTQRIDKRKSFVLLKPVLTQYKTQLFRIIGLILIGSLLQFLMPFLTQLIVDKGINGKDIGLIWLILLGEFIIVISSTLADFVRRWLLLKISVKINIDMLNNFFVKLLKLPMNFFETKLTGDLLQRMSDHNRVRGFMTGEALNFIFSSLTFIIFGIVLLIYSLKIFLVFICFSILYTIWLLLFIKKRKILDYELFEQGSKNQNMTYQFLSSMQEIKLQNCKERRRIEWEDGQKAMFVIQMKTLKLQQKQESGTVAITEFKNILITVIAALSVINGSISLGAMLAIQYITGQLNAPMSKLISFFYTVQDLRLSLERINEIHSRQEEYTSKETRISPPFKIEFHNVRFKYNRFSLSDTLKNVSIAFQPGEVTAIVGASGSGKSTLVKLMLGYYKVGTGSITINGQNINSIDSQWWRNNCGVVMQEGFLFSESIARNIAVEDGAINHEQLKDAAKTACIDEYIDSLPLKYETLIGDCGIGLSQGQKQRILIARAVYKNPNVLFFDEATNSLDSSNEYKIIRNLKEFYNNKTVIIVAHRLSTVKEANCIVVIDDGKIVQIGTHDELVQNSGKYKSLIENQLALGS